MLLSARMLKDCTGPNSFEPDSQLSWTQGDVLEFFFQLIDLSLDKSDQGFNPAGRRYIPATGATLQITLESIDDAQKIVRYATQPFSLDGSIWKVSVLATDAIRGTPQMRLLLTEGVKVTRGLAKFCINIYPNNNL